MLALLRDRGLRQALDRATRSFIQDHYDKGLMLGRYEAVYVEAMAGRTHR